MRSIAYAMIAALAVSGAAVAVTDSADHYGTTPYCNTQQKDSLSDQTTGKPLVRACEGEHWEGGDYNTARGTSSSCQAATPTSNGWLVSHNYCPGSSLTDNSNGIGDVGARSSGAVVGSSASVYTGVHIGGVGKTSTWVEYGSDGKLHVVWFGQDNTDQAGVVTCLAYADEDCNVLASIVHDVGITKGSAVKEESPDCSQNDPNNASNNYEKGTCARDNTSIGLVLG